MVLSLFWLEIKANQVSFFCWLDMMVLKDLVWHLQSYESDYVDGHAQLSRSAQIPIITAVEVNFCRNDA